MDVFSKEKKVFCCLSFVCSFHFLGAQHIFYGKILLFILKRGTLEQWCEKSLWTREAKKLVSTAGLLMFGLEAKFVPLGYVQSFVESNEGMKTLTEGDDGHQRERVCKGMSAVAEALAKQIGSVKLGMSVSSICGNVVKCIDGQTFVAKKGVIIAIPTHFAVKDISFDPPLDEERVRISNSLRMGHISKVILIYSSAWWREKGLNGELLFLDPNPVAMVVDSCAPGVFALTCFVNGICGDEWAKLSSEKRLEDVLNAIDRGGLGGEVRKYTKVLEKIWRNDALAGGCPVWFPDEQFPNDWLEKLRKPHNSNVFFAG